MISAATLVAVVAVLWQIYQMKQRQKEMLILLDMFNQTAKEIAHCIDHCNEAEQNTIKALNQICEALNHAFNVGGAYMNDTGTAIMNIAVCMIPFIDDIKECAIEDEDYERAQECIKIISNLKQITKPFSHE